MGSNPREIGSCSSKWGFRVRRVRVSGVLVTGSILTMQIRRISEIAVAESNSSFLSALQTYQGLHISMNTQLTYKLFYNIFNPMENVFFSRDLHARAIEFD